ncbi:tetratricopeptide repeat protein [Streptomyces sp. NPDC005406]|uniref:tetratricopeptide repeat protein n=1 Tax=Streptomyces sp. NPDC005406 TaxID=3155339 RepID=UPI003451C366
MGAVRIVLPVLRRAAGREGRGAGARPLVVALLRCSSPHWVLLRPQPLPRRLAWAAEAVESSRAAAAGGRRGGAGLLARSLVLHAQLLLDSGRYEEALAAAEGSLAIADAQASPTQTAYCHLLRSLALVRLDRYDEGVVAARRSVAAYRSATPRRADLALGSTEAALRAHAWALGRSGRTAESVEVYLQCVELLRKVTLWHQFRLERLHTRVLIELTGGLRELGRFGEGVEAGSDARERAASLVPRLYPEARTMYAGLLVDLAWCHGATGDLVRARATAEEAVTRCRALSGSAPAAGAPLLALALDCLAYCLERLDAHAEERAVNEELVHVCERLAVTDPGSHEPGLAAALDSLARSYSRDGEGPESVAATERCVELYRRALGREPFLYEGELARTLSNLSVRRRMTDDATGAVAAGGEALAITRRLAGSGEEELRPLVADRLRILGRARCLAEDDEGAAACFEEAETLLRQLMEVGDPVPHEAGLAAAQSALSEALGAAVDGHLDAGRTDEAVAALRRLKELTGRTALTEVHAACVSAFVRSRDRDAEGTRAAWRRMTGEPWPSFVYRPG